MTSAGAGTRGLATFVDYAVVGVLAGFSAGALMASVPLQFTGDNFGLRSVACAMVFAALFDASPWQGTPGKKLTGLLVGDEQGRRLSLWRALWRCLLKVLVAPLIILQVVLYRLWQPGPLLHDELSGTSLLERWRTTAGGPAKSGARP